jgi:hypothetical protein
MRIFGPKGDEMAGGCRKLYNELGGPQSRSGRRGEERILDPIGTRTETPHSFSRWPVAIPTALSRLPVVCNVLIYGTEVMLDCAALKKLIVVQLVKEFLVF